LIPICLVTGFLGSGKTTFLRHLAVVHAARRLVYLVNEFSPRDIDGALVSATAPDVISVPGGSIFCRCLVTEFIARLQEIPRRFGAIEGVVIEASGMANPKVMATMLRETRLDQQYRLATVLAVVDPGSFGKLRRTLPNIVAQIEAADVALINKTDLFPPEIVAGLAAELQSLNTGLEILPCVRGQVDPDLFGDRGGARPDGGEYAPCRDPRFETVAIPVRRVLEPATLAERLRAVEDEMYRLKGYLQTTSGLVYVDYTKTGFNAAPVAPGPEPVVVLIHRGNPSPQVQQFFDWLGAGDEDPATRR
jgi:G3E family GTPase